MSNEQQYSHDEVTMKKDSPTVFIPTMEALDALNDAPTGMELRARYWVPQAVGEKRRAFFVGFQKMRTDRLDENGQNVYIPAAVFASPDGPFIHAGATIVEQARSISQGTAVEITYEGESANKKSQGKTKIFIMRTLKVAPVAPAPTTHQIEGGEKQDGDSKPAVTLNLPPERIEKGLPVIESWVALGNALDADAQEKTRAAVYTVLSDAMGDMTALGIADKHMVQISPDDTHAEVAKKLLENVKRLKLHHEGKLVEAEQPKQSDEVGF